ncbi:FeoA family protein [Priestia taiwanensis]|uniref:Iron transporter FeoA n=1 Tax=Priestia taiwanensis TaxID=1347902 RepID=A0A917ATF6_9BACI|nr:FeoA family protein [Priestia taiwanensis]MBM7363263.1 ferrous iron transport protein A [Priestia taiwanensis]GGE68986.1 iron transporter FeoA [Priestia taiwanensis]
MNASTYIKLSDTQFGDTVIIEEMHITGTMRRRLMDLGFVPGALVHVLQRSPLGDPIAFQLNNTTIALRKEESSQIIARKLGEEQ